jgi:preprotein translocase subunit YajC
MKKISLAVLALFSTIICPQFVFAQAAAGGFGGMGSFLPIILIFVFFYIFLLRPQQKKAKEHQKLLNTLKKDDKVIAAGGIFGSVVSVDGNKVEIRVADGINISVVKASVSTVFVAQAPQGGQADSSVVHTADIIKK